VGPGVPLSEGTARAALPAGLAVEAVRRAPEEGGPFFGASGVGGAGGNYAANDNAGGGGGGGYYGGGGGTQGEPGGGGGGGSSYAVGSATGVVMQQGVHPGNGQIVISY